MSNVRVRPVSITVQVHAVADDGETLEPLQIPPVSFTAAQFEGFDLGEQIARVQEQLDAHVDAPAEG